MKINEVIRPSDLTLLSEQEELLESLIENLQEVCVEIGKDFATLSANRNWSNRLRNLNELNDVVVDMLDNLKQSYETFLISCGPMSNFDQINQNYATVKPMIDGLNTAPRGKSLKEMKMKHTE